MGIDDRFRIQIGTVHTADGKPYQGLDKILSGSFYTFKAECTESEAKKNISYDLGGYLRFNRNEDGRYEYLAFIYSPNGAEMLKGWAHRDVKFRDIKLVVYAIMMSYLKNNATNVKEILDVRKSHKTSGDIIDNLLKIPTKNILVIPEDQKHYYGDFAA
jgi:hypothetical protein